MKNTKWVLLCNMSLLSPKLTKNSRFFATKLATINLRLAGFGSIWVRQSTAVTLWLRSNRLNVHVTGEINGFWLKTSFQFNAKQYDNEASNDWIRHEALKQSVGAARVSGGGEVSMRQSQRSRMPKLQRHRVGIVLAESWFRGKGGSSPPPHIGTTSQWLLSSLYYAKTCILEGARLGVESHTRLEN